MEITSVYPGSSGNSIACSMPLVYVNGQRRRDLAATVWETMEAPDFGRAELQLLLDAQNQPSRLETVGSLPPVGAKILLSANDGGGEFRGVVTSQSSQADPQAERLVAVAAHELTDILRPALSSFVQRGQGDKLVTVCGAEICFNKQTSGLCSPGPVAVGKGKACVFSAEAAARSWTVADALGYLLATGVPASVETQGLAELDSLAGYIDLGVLHVTGLSVLDALVHVAKRGGLALRAARDGLGLVFYRPGIASRLRQVSLQTAGSTFSRTATNLCRASVTIHRRPSQNGVLALGQAKRYELTLPLQPGWDRSLETPRWRDFVRGMSDNWPVLCDVYRKWLLNEHGWYSTPPWNLPAYSFAGINASDFCLLAPRRPLPCLSTNANRQSLGFVVETRCDSQQPWRQWRGPLWVSRHECAVYLGGDALGADFFQAAVQGLAQVRLTATIEADTRIQAQIDGSAGCGLDVLDLSTRAAWRKVHSSSVFYQVSGLGDPAERDDLALLQRAAIRRQESSLHGVQAHLELGWIDTAFQIGDIVDRIDGRNLDLQAGAVQPSVVSVRHDFLKQSTHLEVRG